MSHWNQRVLVQEEGDDFCLTIHEVHYDDNGNLRAIQSGALK